MKTDEFGGDVKRHYRALMAEVVVMESAALS